MLNKFFKLFFSLLLPLILLVGCTSTIKIEVFQAPEVEKPIEKKSLTISFAGDVTLGNYIGSPYYGTFDSEFNNRNGDFSYFFKNVSDIFKKDDITIVNLEGTLTASNSGNTEKAFAFRGDPSYVNILKEGFVDAVSLANNHSYDYFEKGFEDTKKILDENNIKYAGMGSTSIIEANGLKLGLLAYNGWDSNYNDDFLQKIQKDISKIKEESNIVAIYFHWGIERDNYPTTGQINFAHFAIDNGADLVIGSHPHVLQGIEVYKGKYIAYSLGNFCFGGNRNPADKDSMIYQQTFNFENGKLVGLQDPNIIPCSISSENSRNNYQPTPLNGSEAERVLNKIKTFSKPL